MVKHTPKPGNPRRRPRSISLNPIVCRFATVVGDYCKLLESETKNRKKMLCRLVDVLPELFFLAIRLPKGRKSDRIARELNCISVSDRPAWPASEKERAMAHTSKYRHTHVSTQEFFAMTRRLSKILGEQDRYREIFDPFEDKDAIQTSVSNDLAEIWHDLKPNLLLYNLGDESSMRHAVYEWALSVRLHWGGAHFASAMKPITRALTTMDPFW